MRDWIVKNAKMVSPHHLVSFNKYINWSKDIPRLSFLSLFGWSKDIPHHITRLVLKWSIFELDNLQYKNTIVDGQLMFAEYSVEKA